eukprot:scaffold1970_cov396-Prasinococcus_capsulatus_cf.AAC.19
MLMDELQTLKTSKLEELAGYGLMFAQMLIHSYMKRCLNEVEAKQRCLEQAIANHQRLTHLILGVQSVVPSLNMVRHNIKHARLGTAHARYFALANRCEFQPGRQPSRKRVLKAAKISVVDATCVIHGQRRCKEGMWISCKKSIAVITRRWLLLDLCGCTRVTVPATPYKIPCSNSTACCNRHTRDRDGNFRSDSR